MHPTPFRLKAQTQEFEHLFIPAQKATWAHNPQLMIVLHGRGDSLKPFRRIGGELQLPEMNYLLLNAPRRYAGGYTWYAFPPNQKRGVLLARSKLYRLIHELRLQGWPPENLYFLGFSQGCLVTGDLALNYPYPLGGIVGVSGYFYLFPQWKKRLKPPFTPWLITHGKLDEDLPIDFTRRQVEEIRQAGYPVQWREYKKGHEFSLKELNDIRTWLRARFYKRDLVSL